jgi:hypothetical protein
LGSDHERMRATLHGCDLLRTRDFADVEDTDAGCFIERFAGIVCPNTSALIMIRCIDSTKGKPRSEATITLRRAEAAHRSALEPARTFPAFNHWLIAKKVSKDQLHRELHLSRRSGVSGWEPGIG